MDNACQPEGFHSVWGCEACLPVDGLQGMLPSSRTAWRPENLELNESEGRTDTNRKDLAHPASLPLALTISHETAK